MSNKRWYSIFNPNTLKWETRGIKYDDGPLLNNGDELFFGEFKTKRGADFCSRCGYLTGSIKNMEILAKAEEASTTGTEDILKLNMNVEIPEEILGSYISAVLSRMMD